MPLPPTRRDLSISRCRAASPALLRSAPVRSSVAATSTSLCVYAAMARSRSSAVRSCVASRPASTSGSSPSAVASTLRVTSTERRRLLRSSGCAVHPTKSRVGVAAGRASVAVLGAVTVVSGIGLPEAEPVSLVGAITSLNGSRTRAGSPSFKVTYPDTPAGYRETRSTPPPAPRAPPTRSRARSLVPRS